MSIEHPVTAMGFAIDFGTSNTVIARWNPAEQTAMAISLPGLAESEQSPLIPSLVYVHNAATPEFSLGQQVITQALNLPDDTRLFRNFKRGIGAQVQGYLPILEGQPISLEQVGAWFLQGIYHQLQQRYPDVRNSLTLTVPVDSFEAYRLWLTQSCGFLDVEQLYLLDEPTAAALGYGLGECRNILVIDCGGGTLDLALLQQPTSVSGSGNLWQRWGRQLLGSNMAEPTTPRPKVIAKAGRTLGGSDIDLWIGEYFQAQAQIPITPWTLRLMERLKMQLSHQTQAQEFYRDANTGKEQDLTLTQAELEQILSQHQFFDRWQNALTQVLNQAQNAGVSSPEIEAVILIGGTCQMPTVQAWVAAQFPDTKIAADHPLTAVATGALSFDHTTGLEDFLYHGYGIRYWDHRLQRHNWHQIIASGQSYPMAQPIEIVLGASTPDQPGLELILGELGRAEERIEIFFNHGQLQTKIVRHEPTVQALNDTPQSRTLAQLDPPGQPGQDRLKILFWVNEQRQLRVSVDDLLTKTRIVENQLVVTLK